MLAAVVLAVVVMTRDTSSKPAAPITGPDVETADPVPEPSPDTVALTSVATSADFERYESRKVTATSVKVLTVVGPSAAWIEPTAGRRVLLVLVGATEAFTAKAGATVSFTGIVQRAGPGFGEALGLSGADLQAFERQGGYVETDAVAVG